MADLVPPFDAEEAERVLVNVTRNYGDGARADGVVLGVSGGVDSALVAAIAVKAFGADRVLGLILPHASSNPEDAAHARLVGDALGIELREIPITGVTDAVAEAVGPGVADVPMAASNLKPRARMMILYAHANAMNRLVLGTGNKSELLVGYFTKYGDGGADVYPIGDVYKTHVFTLARRMGVPAPIVDKAPSAGLWAGQTDESELGISYADLDRVLYGFEGELDDATVARRAGIAPGEVARVRGKVESSAHKRAPLFIPKLGFRTPGLDWREPRIRGRTGSPP